LLFHDHIHSQRVKNRTRQYKRRLSLRAKRRFSAQRYVPSDQWYRKPNTRHDSYKFPADVIEALRQEQQCDRKMLQRGEDNRNLSKTVLKPPSSSVNNECRLKRISRRHRARRPDRPTKRGSLLPLSLQTLSVVGDGKETRPPPPPAAPWTPSNPSSTLIPTYSRHDTKHGADYRRRNSGRGFPRNHTYGTNELNGFDQNAQGAEGPRGDDNVFSKTPQASDSASVMSQAHAQAHSHLSIPQLRQRREAASGFFSDTTVGRVQSEVSQPAETRWDNDDEAQINRSEALLRSRRPSSITPSSPRSLSPDTHIFSRSKNDLISPLPHRRSSVPQDDALREERAGRRLSRPIGKILPLNIRRRRWRHCFHCA